ncbi:hypothetical protein CNR22_15030 [Sphingobacteriaceae bacterium]|nr:hypothetical protein CNR22_15030 [Sphingobacteriaceae bacterium]
MKIEYVCHSALYIHTEDLTILTDPWLSGATYCNQWHLFPKPQTTDLVKEAEVILISHGHEDHLHHDSLLTLNKKSKIIYPFQWQKGIKEYLGSIGYTDICEAISHKSYKLSKSTTVTYIANSLDSIMIIESGGEVLVNINDALPANHKNIIKAFLKKIKAEWPKIDYLFCGYGSAAYFPNTVHCEGKDDLEIAEAREQLFGDNFCYIVDELAPLNTIPFAADYVLLNEGKRWINRVKLSKTQIKNYYHDIYKGRSTNFIIAYPGDRIEKNHFTKRSLFHAREKLFSLDELIDMDLSEEIKSVNTTVFIGENEITQLEKALTENIIQRSSLFSTEQRSKIIYTVIVTDIVEKNYFNIDCSGTTVQVTRENTFHPKSILILETSSKILNYSFASEWGGDAIIIGYGAEITILDKRSLEKNLDVICVRLLTRQPVASKQMKASPFRALKFLLVNPLTSSWFLKQVLKGRNNVNKNPVNERNLWLTKSKCEICQVCNIPLLSNDFAQSLK